MTDSCRDANQDLGQGDRDISWVGKASLWRGDILRADCVGMPGQLDDYAVLLGFERLPELEGELEGRRLHRLWKRSALPSDFTRLQEERHRDLQGATELDEDKVAQPSKFWRVTSQVDQATLTELKGRRPPDNTAPWNDPEREGRTYSIPASPPLESWPRIWRRLRPMISRCVEGTEVDVELAVESYSCGGPLDHIPLLKWPTLIDKLDLVEDKSRRLVPFWGDQKEVRRRLKRVMPRHALTIHRCYAGSGRLEALARRPARVDSPTILVLGDLGFYGAPHERNKWLRLGRALQRSRAQLRALVPCPEGRFVPSVAKIWGAEPWDTHERNTMPVSSELINERATRLLRLLSPAIRIEPGLLRAMRRVLSTSEHELDRLMDCGIEADAYSHASVALDHSEALTLEDSALEEWSADFKRENLDLKRRSLALIAIWHEDLPQEIFAEELVRLSLVDEDVIPRNAEEYKKLVDDLRTLINVRKSPRKEVRIDLNESRNLLIRVGKALADERDVPFGARLWLCDVEQRILWSRDKDLENAFRAALARLHSDGEEQLQSWRIWQVGDQLEILPVEGQDGEAPRPGPSHSLFGSPLGEIRARRRSFKLKTPSHDGPWTPIHPTRGISVAIPRADAFTITTDLSQLTVKTMGKPEWAAGMGRDRFGLFVDIELNNVRHRMRWVPPGRFMMGSPENEPERFDNEILHEVELTEGFWLGETACTQELWQAVMRENPSKFKGPMTSPEGEGRRPEMRPVETVSWDDCKKFLEKANELLQGLDLRLPREAEWEYACRAGTETPFSFGSNITPEQVNYDGDFPYGGGAKGLDRQETVPVGSLPANGWGFHEMHGNVYEWCKDWYGDYEEGLAVNPHGPNEGPGRVLRGGSWLYYAGFSRSAYRHYAHPDFRGHYFGLRLARGQEGLE